MLTKEQILCGTIEELVGYFTIGYNPTLNDYVGDPIKDAIIRQQNLSIKYFYYYTTELGNVVTQLNRIEHNHNSTGLVYLFASRESKEEIPEVTIEIIKFWVFVRASRTEDATSAS